MPSRPAVSTTTTSCCVRRASSERVAGDVDRVADAVARLGREHLDPRLLADHLQLVDRVGALQVGRDQQRGVPLLASASSPSLPASVVLPEPCRPASMITVGGVLAYRSRRVSPPRISMSSSLTILMTCWAGFSALADLRAAGPLLDRGDERAHHRQRDVGLEQRDADLAGGGVDVVVGQPALAAQRGEDLVRAGWRGCRTPDQPSRPAALPYRMTGLPSGMAFPPRSWPNPSNRTYAKTAQKANVVTPAQVK